MSEEIHESNELLEETINPMEKCCNPLISESSEKDHCLHVENISIDLETHSSIHEEISKPKDEIAITNQSESMNFQTKVIDSSHKPAQVRLSLVDKFKNLKADIQQSGTDNETHKPVPDSSFLATVQPTMKGAENTELDDTSTVETLNISPNESSQIDALDSAPVAPVVTTIDPPNKPVQTMKKFTVMKDKQNERSLRRIALQKSRYCFTERVLRNRSGKVQAVGAYVVTEELGRGAFGSVFKVEIQQENDELATFAMKMFVDMGKSKGLRRVPNSPGYADDGPRDAILKEAALMKALSHPHLIRLVEIVEEKNSPYSLFVVMEYAGMGPLMSLRKNTEGGGGGGGGSSSPQFYTKFTENGLFGEAMASRLFREIICGMAYLHLNKIAHRDLKPDNLMLTDSLSVKIVDFGVSRQFTGESVRGGLVSDTQGTWPFWSPEMCDESGDQSRYSAFAADVWAAGVVLWVMTFGGLPFFGNSPDEIFDKILLPLPERPSRRSPEFEAFLLAVLHPDVAQRPSFLELQSFEWIRQHTTSDVEDAMRGAHAEVDLSTLEMHSTVTQATTVNLTDLFKEKLRDRIEVIRTNLKHRSINLQKQHSKEADIRRDKFREGHSSTSFAASDSGSECGDGDGEVDSASKAMQDAKVRSSLVASDSAMDVTDTARETIASVKSVPSKRHGCSCCSVS